MKTTPTGFSNPHPLANKVARVLWSVAHALCFRPTPQWMGPWRSWLLRIFGAKIQRARLHQTVRIWAPWRLEIGKDVYIGEYVELYNVYGLRIGDRVIISRRSFLCTASHDFTLPHYPLVGGKISIQNDSWIAAEAFLGPHVTIGTGAVVGARAVVVKDVPSWAVVGGNPAQVIKKRVLKDSET